MLRDEVRRDLLEKNFDLRNDVLFPADLLKDRNAKSRQPRNDVLSQSHPGLHEHLLYMETVTVSHEPSREQQTYFLTVHHYLSSA